MIEQKNSAKMDDLCHISSQGESQKLDSVIVSSTEQQNKNELVPKKSLIGPL